MSTDSDSYRGRRRGGRRDGGPISHRVESLASSLQDTNRNLREVDKMLGEYRGLGDHQSEAIDKLKQDLARSTDRLTDEKRRRKRDLNSSRSLRPSDLEDDYTRGQSKDRRGRRSPTSPLRDYERAASDYEAEQFDGRRSYAPRGRSNVRFHDDMDADASLHELHQSMRDMSSDQSRVQNELNREIHRRNKEERESRAALQHLLENSHPPARLEKTMSTVDRRLQSIQDELQRGGGRRRPEDAAKVSSELQQALDVQKHAETQVELRAKLAESESARAMLENELVRSGRLLEEGRPDVVRGPQVDELRKQLSRAEEDNQQIKRQVQQQQMEAQNRLKAKSLDERQEVLREQEVRRLQAEVHELRGQLSKSAAVMGDYGDVSRKLEKSERQRTQLSDHIESLSSEVESREKQAARAVNSLAECRERLEESERQRSLVTSQLEETQRRLTENTAECEGLSKQVTKTQTALTESENKRKEMKLKAQETVKQWKLKCKRVERDLARQTQTSEQAASRTEQLLRDLEASRTHSGSSSQQMDLLKRELAELVGVRAQQDEQLRIRDMHVNELKSLKMDLERNFTDSKMVIDRLEHELQSSHEKIQKLNEEKNRLEEQQSSIHQAHYLADSQLQAVQKEMKEVSAQRVEAAAQLAEMARERQELRSSLQEARQSESAARDEVMTLNAQLTQNRENTNQKIEALKTELDSYVGQESLRLHEMSHRHKKERAEYEAELQALRLEHQEEKSSSRLMRRNLEKYKREVERLNDKVTRCEEEVSREQQKYLQVREEFITKSQLTEEDLARAKDFELALLDVKEKMRRMENDQQNVLHLVSLDVDSVVDVMCSNDHHKMLPASKPLSSTPQTLLAEIRAKLELVKSELRGRQVTESRLKTEVRDAVKNSEKDCSVLIAEINRQSDVLDSMSQQKKLDGAISPARSPTPPVTREHDVDAHTASLLEAAKREREKIEERYTRLQGTMQSLRQDLCASTLYSGLNNSPPRRKSKSPRRVRISCPGDKEEEESLSHSPSPLSLSDEAFNRKFMGRSTSPGPV